MLTKEQYLGLENKRWYTFAELQEWCEYRDANAIKATKTGFYNGDTQLSIKEFVDRFHLSQARADEDVVFHDGTRITFGTALRLCERAQDGIAIGNILVRFGQWVVDRKYVSCLAVPHYFIRRDQLELDNGETKRHLLGKLWLEPNNWYAICKWVKANPIRKESEWRVGLSLRIKIIARDKSRCQLCGTHVSEGARIEVDHIIPKSKGGTNHPSNLWVLCFDCNRGKRDKFLEELEA